MSGNPAGSLWRSTPPNRRRRRSINLTLSDEAKARLERLAEDTGESRSAIVEELILAARGR